MSPSRAHPLPALPPAPPPCGNRPIRIAGATAAALDWAEVEQARHRLGPKLAELRAQQDQQPYARQ